MERHCRVGFAVFAAPLNLVLFQSRLNPETKIAPHAQRDQLQVRNARKIVANKWRMHLEGKSKRLW
jgi:hypothetical protein